MRRIKILGTGLYLPKKCIKTKELEEKTGATEEVLLKKSGVLQRYYVSDGETASIMGAHAARSAVEKAGLSLDQIDLVLCTSGTMEMPIPCTATLIHKELGLSTVPAFDINSTCLSFLTGLDVISHLVESGTYQNVLLVSTEISSAGLNMSNLESASLFGDGAVAVVICRSKKSESSKIYASKMVTYSESWDACRIPGGGSGYIPENWTPKTAHMFQFQMNGKKVFKLISKHLPSFVDEILDGCDCSMSDIDVVVPHQASQSAMNIMQKKLNISDGQFVNIIKNRGNVIAASIPMALHEAIQDKRIVRGSKVMMIGTSAGLSIGGLIFEY